MNPSDVAKKLLTLLNAPVGTVTVLPVPDKSAGYILRVWVQNGASVPNVPETFCGHKIDVKRVSFAVGH